MSFLSCSFSGNLFFISVLVCNFSISTYTYLFQLVAKATFLMFLIKYFIFSALFQFNKSVFNCFC